VERRRKGVLTCAAAAIVWAGTAPGIDYLLGRGVPKLTIALWRDGSIAVVLFAVFAFRRGPIAVSRRVLAELAVVGAIAVGLYHVLWTYSVAENGAALAVVFVYTYNVFTALGARVLYGEPLRRLHMVAIGLSLVGLVFAVRAYDPDTWNTSWRGAVLGIGSAMVQAVYVLGNQRLSDRVHPFGALAYQMLFGSIVLAIITLVLRPGDVFAFGGSRNVLWLIFLGIGPTLGGYGLFNVALRFIPGKSAGLITTLEIPVAALISYLALGDKLLGPQYIGLGLVVVASALASQAAADAEMPTELLPA
jgi:drug/metabolite transporter (DMT)-like permease